MQQSKFIVSPSALKTAGRCMRSWGFGRLARRREPETEPQQIGTYCHSIAERWLSLGVLRGADRWVDVFVEGIPYLPPPGEAGVEIPWRVDLDGVSCGGLIDVVDWADRCVYDHKFTGGFRYALTVEELETDEQAVLYTLALGWPTVRLQWVYYDKRGSGCQPVGAYLTRDQALETWRTKYLPLAREMVRHAAEIPCADTQETVDQINAEVSHDNLTCWAFGKPCIHRAYCTRYP